MKKHSIIYKLAVALFCIAVLLPIPVFANPIEESTAGSGTLALINDATKWLTVVGPVAGGMCAIFFLIRKSGADEVDQKMWQKRVNTAIISGVGTMLISGVIALITSYYV